MHLAVQNVFIMARKREFDLWNRVIGGDMPQLLKQMRADGLNPSQISHRLYADYEIDVTSQTIRRWLMRVDETGVV